MYSPGTTLPVESSESDSDMGSETESDSEIGVINLSIHKESGASGSEKSLDPWRRPESKFKLKKMENLEETPPPDQQQRFATINSKFFGRGRHLIALSAPASSSDQQVPIRISELNRRRLNFTALDESKPEPEGISVSRLNLFDTIRDNALKTNTSLHESHELDPEEQSELMKVAPDKCEGNEIKAESLIQKESPCEYGEVYLDKDMVEYSKLMNSEVHGSSMVVDTQQSNKSGAVTIGYPSALPLKHQYQGVSSGFDIRSPDYKVGALQLSPLTVRPFEMKEKGPGIVLLVTQGTLYVKTHANISTDENGHKYMESTRVDNGMWVTIPKGLPYSIENRSTRHARAFVVLGNQI